MGSKNISLMRSKEGFVGTRAEPADAIDMGRKAIAPMDMTEPPTRIQIAT